MGDNFKNLPVDLNSPAEHVEAVVPNDSADLPNSTRALSVGVTGDVHLVTVAGDEETVYMAAGQPFPIRVKRVFATGTTATNIVALW